MNVCPECDYHWYVSAQQRIAQVFDEGTFEEFCANLLSADPLSFRDRRTYPERIRDDQMLTGLKEAAVVGVGRVRARRVAFGVTDSRFIMGSMGAVVGEKLVRVTELATKENLPLVIISGSGGGARMHEGILSLMQMAKVSAALARHHQSGGLFISDDESHDGRRGGQLCFAGRFDFCRTQSPDRFCRPSDHQGDASHGIAKRIPDERVSLGAWLH